MENSLLQEAYSETKNNYITSIYKEKDSIGIATIDITTGVFVVTEFSGEFVLSHTNDYLVSIKPSEVIINSEMVEYYNTLQSVMNHYIPKAEVYSDDNFDFNFSNEILKKQLKTQSLKTFNINNRHYAICSAGALINYILDKKSLIIRVISLLKKETPSLPVAISPSLNLVFIVLFHNKITNI